jgi:hypothetical protein
MKEIHGVSDAKRCAALADQMQDVTVEDGNGEVRLILGTSSYPAGLTPEQAEFVAKQLLRSCERVRAETRRKNRVAKQDAPPDLGQQDTGGADHG